MSDETSNASGFDFGEITGSVGESPGVGGLGPGFEGGGTAVPAVPLAGEHPAGVAEQAHVSFRTAALYSSGNFSAGMWYALNNFILPLFLGPLKMAPILIGLLSSTRSAEGAVLQPIIGAWSDRLWTPRFGRRRIFIVRFVPICAFFVILTPFVPALSSSGPLAALQRALGMDHTFFVLALVALAIFLFTLTFNIMYDPYQALLADITPEARRGWVNGIFQMFGAGGQSFILVVGAASLLDVNGLFVFCGIALVLCFIPTVLGVREPRVLPGAKASHRYTVRDYWNGIRADPQIQLYFANQAFLWFGINAITPFLTLFAEKEAHFSAAAALSLSFILLLSSAVFVWPFGFLGDRIGLKQVFILGMICMAGAAIAGTITHAITPLYIIVFVAGIGNAAQTASSFPLMTRLVPADQMGLYTGIESTVTSVAAPVSAFIAGLFIQTMGYSAMFPFVAVMFLASLVPLGLLRVEKSRVQQALRAAHGQTA
ncbi:MAG: hypothetical protein OJF49_002781 [Ktedonobacterales bacterium]|jgi:MFS family permease|nr:MAG: hypothetical protein OJF49_002781 [Ktedonobacterales bacterium]